MAKSLSVDKKSVILLKNTMHGYVGIEVYFDKDKLIIKDLNYGGIKT
jgi:hypothetical protein